MHMISLYVGEQTYDMLKFVAEKHKMSVSAVARRIVENELKVDSEIRVSTIKKKEFNLTPGSAGVLRFIVIYQITNGAAPTYQQIANEYNITRQRAQQIVMRLVSNKKLKIHKKEDGSKKIQWFEVLDENMLEKVLSVKN